MATRITPIFVGAEVLRDLYQNIEAIGFARPFTSPLSFKAKRQHSLQSEYEVCYILISPNGNLLWELAALVYLAVSNSRPLRVFSPFLLHRMPHVTAVGLLI